MFSKQEGDVQKYQNGLKCQEVEWGVLLKSSKRKKKNICIDSPETLFSFSQFFIWPWSWLTDGGKNINFIWKLYFIAVLVWGMDE